MKKRIHTGSEIKPTQVHSKQKLQQSEKLALIVWVHGLGEKKVSGDGAVKISPEQA